ncbi:class I SAM-dependent methyltransferase [Acinetobacter sp. MB5]|uniref:class I SAM-dependent methyltransferase n=1 Tax=Acinetobacter sp. MB5 TaxID=2069438 RepID=UPI000DD0A5AD|nr:class I SAM-dependent methyltransferase [Acinetobacter sp. MB5]
MNDNYWEQVYKTKEVNQVSWYQEKKFHLIDLLKTIHLPANAHIIDVGSGASCLIDHLLELGYKNLSVLDLSETALKTTQSRLNEKNLDATHVEWITADVCQVKLPKHFFDLWHDRAVFHFMVSQEQQEKYLNTMRNALKKESFVAISTFSENGPTQCSGLPVERYDIEKMKKRLGADFKLYEYNIELHETPWGSKQEFLNTLWVFDPQPSQEAHN